MSDTFELAFELRDATPPWLLSHLREWISGAGAKGHAYLVVSEDANEACLFAGQLAMQLAVQLAVQLAAIAPRRGREVMATMAPSAADLTSLIDEAFLLFTGIVHPALAERSVALAAACSLQRAGSTLNLPSCRGSPPNAFERR